MPKKINWNRVSIPESELFVFEYANVGSERWERVRRPPGVRTLCVNKERTALVLQSEFRHAMDAVDWRLPGGKVFDDAESWLEFLDNGGDIVQAAVEQGIREAQEEAGVKVRSAKLLEKVIMTATIERDLYYIESNDWELTGDHAREEHEKIGEVREFSRDEVQQLIKSNKIKEDFTVAVLLRRFL